MAKDMYRSMMRYWVRGNELPRVIELGLSGMTWQIGGTKFMYPKSDQLAFGYM